MKYGYTTINFVIALILFTTSCSPQYRFVRLVKNHPYLLDSFVTRDIQVQTIEKVDTQFVWKTERDTIEFRTFRMERFRDTIRFYSRERSCTTYLHTTEIRPSKTIEKYISQKTSEGLKGQVYQALVFLLIGAFISIILFRK